MWRGTVADQIWDVRGLAMVGVVGLEDGGGRWDGMGWVGVWRRGWRLARLRCGGLGVALGLCGSLVLGVRFGASERYDTLPARMLIK